MPTRIAGTAGQGAPPDMAQDRPTRGGESRAAKVAAEVPNALGSKSPDNPGHEIDSITSRLTRASAASLSDYMSRLAHDKSRPLDHRLEELRDIKFIADELIEAITPKLPDKAPVLWRDREDRDVDPYVFAHAVYADYIGIITKTDIERLDKSLLNQMNLRDRTKGRPSPDLFIPTKREKNAPLVETVTWADIIEAAPERVKVMLRAYKARMNRESLLRRSPTR